ncbi:hypothetical protein ACHAQH_006777 [Verticillium albo-atrum]
MASPNSTPMANDGAAADGKPKQMTIGDIHPDNDKYRGLTGDGEENNTTKQMYFEEDFKFVMPDHLRRPHQVHVRAVPTSSGGASPIPERSDMSSTQLVEPRSTVSESTARDKYVESSNESVKPSLAFRVAGKVDHFTDAAQNAVKQRKQNDKKNGTICGMRRKMFWLVVALAVLIIVGLAVGLGVGLAVANSGDGWSDYYLYDGYSNFSNVSTTPREVFMNTTLTSLNFTDEYGHDNFVVFYQLNSKELCRSWWNSSLEKWTAAIVGNDTAGVKQGTPLSSSVYWYDDSNRDVRLYAVSDDNSLDGWISGTQVDGTILDTWTSLGLANSGAIPVGDESTIVSNGRESQGALLLNMVLYQDNNGTLHLLQDDGSQDEPTWTSSIMPFGRYPPTWGSRMALVPVYRQGGPNVALAPSLSLFYDADSGGLRQASFQDANNVNQVWDSVGASPPGFAMNTDAIGPRNSVIAAFSSGWNDTSDDLKLQVLSQDGVLTSYSYPSVMLAAYQYGDWGDEEYITTMGGNKSPLTVAANQAGRVYGTIVQNTSVVIYEWAWEGGNSYRPIGAVNTTLPLY